jgi:chromosome segregation ATPase
MAASRYPPSSYDSGKVGRLEGEMDNVQKDIDELKEDLTQTKKIVGENAVSISNLTMVVKTYIDDKNRQEREKKQELSRWEVVIVSSMLSTISGIIVGTIVYLMR